MGVNLPFRGPLSFAASHQNVVPLKEIKEEARSFGEGEEWEGKKGDGSVCLPVCPFALLRANLVLFMEVPKLAVTQVLLLSSIIHPTG